MALVSLFFTRNIFKRYFCYKKKVHDFFSCLNFSFEKDSLKKNQLLFDRDQNT